MQAINVLIFPWNFVNLSSVLMFTTLVYLDVLKPVSYRLASISYHLGIPSIDKWTDTQKMMINNKKTKSISLYLNPQK